MLNFWGRPQLVRWNQHITRTSYGWPIVVAYKLSDGDPIRYEPFRWSSSVRWGNDPFAFNITPIFKIGVNAIFNLIILMATMRLCEYFIRRRDRKQLRVRE